MKTNIVIATIKSWNIKNFYILQEKLSDKYNITLISDKNKLIYDEIKLINPKYIFFPHWSWIINEEIYSNFNCIVFHMTDLPFGRGGSPLQNLIVRGIDKTKISAIQVDKGIDTGKIYIKEDFYIGIGSADEIFESISNLIFNKMIPMLLENEIIPISQQGEITLFNRRNKDQSNIMNSQINTLDSVYNFIRMLDGEGYPNAFIKINNLKICFSEAHKKNNKIVGRFEIFYDEE